MLCFYFSTLPVYFGTRTLESLLADPLPVSAHCQQTENIIIIYSHSVCYELNAQKSKTHQPMRDNRGLIWLRDWASPHRALWGAAEHSSPLGPALLRGHRWRIVIVLGGGRVSIAIALLSQRFHLLP